MIDFLDILVYYFSSGCTRSLVEERMRFSTAYATLLLVLSGCWFIGAREVECKRAQDLLEPGEQLSRECLDILGLTAESDADTDSDSDTDSDTDTDTDADGDTDSHTALPTADTNNGDIDHTGLIDDAFTTDGDGDGFCEAAIVCTDGSFPGDCDDTEVAARPGLTEVCDEIDNDCAGGVDDGLVIPTWYRDLDTDTFGDPAFSLQACQAPQDYVANADDCDDANPAANPNEQEVCDPADVDEDCNNLAEDADPGLDLSTRLIYWRDNDGDGCPGDNVRQDRCDPTANFFPEDVDGDGTSDFDNDNDTIYDPGGC